MAGARPLVLGPRAGARFEDEWLVPDGLGGYAMGTVAGLRTRRYHGLLMVSGKTPGSRHLGLAALDPVVTLGSGAIVRLGTHEWADGVLGPRGCDLLAGFDLTEGLPRWRWRIGDVVIERELAMVRGRPAAGIVHRLISGGPVTLSLDALCTWRDGHGSRSASGPAPSISLTADGCVVEDAYRLAGPGFAAAGGWYRSVRYREEAARGLPETEDLWYAGSFTAELTCPGETAEVTAWAGDLTAPPPPAGRIVASARTRASALVSAAAPASSSSGSAALASPSSGSEVAAALTLAADAFVVRTAAGPDVVAGYPWFGAWSRDTMISYEGLFLHTGRADLGRELLTSYAATLSEGMLANTADTGSVEYNTADATLWFIHAVGRHVTLTGDRDLAVTLLPALDRVIERHLAGTRYGIGVDPADGLLRQGAPGTALTWMDARVGGVPVTPRTGKAVEINALWINALGTIAELGGARWDRVLATARAGFARRFPTPGGLLHDVVDGPGDSLLRPNQLLAWSLPHATLRPDPAVLSRLGAALLTPLGLRSLAPGEPQYHGRHRGDPAARDTAYHTGTVWPWLIGPYVSAWQRVSREPRTGTRRPAHSDISVLSDIVGHLGEYGLGSVSETADGDAPHGGTGCPFQAWSVAEHLRIRLQPGAS